MNRLRLNFQSIFIFWAAAVLSGPAAQAFDSRVGHQDDLGFGVALGQPIGVTAKQWLSANTAVDAMMGYHFNSNFDVHVDYLWHTYTSFAVRDGRLPFYMGIGGRVLLGNSSQLGARIPVGVSYLPPNDPYEFFVELAPVVKLIKDVGFDMDGLIGVRVYVNYLR